MTTQTEGDIGCGVRSGMNGPEGERLVRAGLVLPAEYWVLFHVRGWGPFAVSNGGNIFGKLIRRL
jgi:hypothetical protein